MTDSKELVKQLRQMTGAGILDCKKYLDKAEAGVKANKKGSRIASEGIVNFYEDDNSILMLELNSETDFVARDSNFLLLAQSIGKNLLNDDSDSDVILEDITSAISKLGENIKLRRHIKISKKNHVYGYCHNNKIAALVELKNNDVNLAKDICMQIVASNPLALDETSLSHDILQTEKEVYKNELEKIDKKEDIKRNILEGKMKKFINENTLLNQPFVKDPSISLSKIINDNQIISYTRYELGEGIEKKSEDFAQEVYNQIS
jgi:elongation factor Ts